MRNENVRIRLLLLALALVVLQAAGGTAFAFQSYLNAFKTAYPAAVGSRIDVCILCHNQASGGSRNAYGTDFASASIGNHTFHATLGAENSDGTGGTNDAEIAALTFPGNANDPSAAAGAMSVMPAGGLSSSGAPGGPFSPSSQQYTLTNTGGTSINWTASKVQSWVTLSSAGGTLAAGANTTVTASINSGANTLAVGSYSDTVTFTNTTNGTGNATRPVSLTVTTAPDTTPPTVVTVDPADTHSGIPVNSVVTVTFSEPVAVPAGSLSLSDGAGSVTGTVSVNGAIVTFDPSVILSDNTTYTVTATTAVTDLTGNPLSAGFSSTFTTSAASPASTLPLETSSGGGGCAMAGTKGDVKDIAGTYGFLILTALGMALRGRVKRKEK